MKHWVNDTTAQTAVTEGLVEGTCVATALGWRAVEALAPGDLVLTFDRGLQPVTAVRRHFMADLGPRHWPLAIPAGALGNSAALTVMPAQGVMIESDLAEGLTGDPFVVVQAAALEGQDGITPVRPTPLAMLVELVFAQDEVVFTRAGALLLCPARGDMLAALWDEAAPGYPVMTGPGARDHVAAMTVAALAA